MRSLSSKTLLLMVALFGVIAAGASLMSASELREQLLVEYRSKGAALVTNIAESDVDLLINRNLERLQSTIDQYIETPGVAFVFVEDGDAEIVAHTFVPGVPPQVRELHGDPGGVTFGELDLGDGGSVLHVSAPILEGVAGFAHVGMDLDSVRRRIRLAVLRLQAVILAIFALSALAAVVLVKRISGPLRDFAGYARRLGHIDVEDLETTGSTVRTRALLQKDEIGVLARSFVDMEHQLKDSVRRLRDTTAEKERLESELKIARKIQQDILPRDLPSGSPLPGVELRARMAPAQDVAGDFYDYFVAKDSKVFFAVGDVSGKGVPASLFMAVTVTLLRAAARETDDPAEVLDKVNRELCRTNDSGLFVTVFLGVLDAATGVVRYCNGGHLPPYLLDEDGASEIREGSGVILGAFDTLDYHRYELRLPPGSSMFLYTDGVSEAFDRDGEMFGDDRLAEVLRSARDRTCAAVGDAVFGAVGDFVAGAPVSDDITLMCLRYATPRSEER